MAIHPLPPSYTQHTPILTPWWSQAFVSRSYDPGGGHSHWQQYTYARTARVPFWPISVPQKVGLSSNVPVRVGFWTPNMCQRGYGIQFLSYCPPGHMIFPIYCRYGSLNVNGSWDGMLGQVIRQVSNNRLFFNFFRGHSKSSMLPIK